MVVSNLLRIGILFPPAVFLAEVKELLHLYYSHKLDAAIDKEEASRNYSAEVYEAWLKRKESDTI